MRIYRNGHVVSDTIAALQSITQRFAGESKHIGLVRCEVKSDLVIEEGDILEVFLEPEEIENLYNQYQNKLSQ